MNKVGFTVSVCHFLLVIDSFFLDTVSSMGRFQGVKIVPYTSRLNYHYMHLPIQHMWAYYQDRQVDPWQGAICGASAGKLCFHQFVTDCHLVLV